MNQKQFFRLIDACLSGKAHKNEQQIVDIYLQRLEDKGQIDIADKQAEALKEEMWQQIHARIVKQADTPVVSIPLYRKNWFRIAAACVILSLVTFLYLNNLQPDPENAIVVNTPADASTTRVHREINTTGKDELFQLPDGSQVVLATGSDFSYEATFTDKRSITLNGKAYFKVAKNKEKPFTVYSGAVSTTALGTEFLITAFPQDGWLTVRLYEGKVRIQPTKRADKQMSSDFYLQPGQEFIYSNKALARVRNFRLNKPNMAWQDNATRRDNPTFSERNDGSWYMFNNQSLVNVLNDLSALYNTPIIFNKKELEKIYFTGKYSKSMPLSLILQRIGKVNNLKIIKTDTAYFINEQ